MRGLVWLGVVLFVVWAVLWLGFKVVSGVVHILVAVAIVLIVIGLLKRGAREVKSRM